MEGMTTGTDPTSVVAETRRQSLVPGVVHTSSVCLWVLCLTACGAAWQPTSLQAQPTIHTRTALEANGPPSEAGEVRWRRAIDAGLAGWRQGHWSEALEHFSTAYGISPDAQTARMIGLVSSELRDYAHAYGYLQAALEHSRHPLRADQRPFVEQLSAEAKNHIFRLELTTDPADAQVLIDGELLATHGKSEVALNPGLHQLRVHAPHHRSAARTVAARRGQRGSMRIALRPTDAQRSRPWRTAAWLALGGAGAFALAATSIWFWGDSRISDIERACNAQGGCTRSEAERAMAREHLSVFETLTTAAWLTASAAAVASGVFWLIELNTQAEPQQAQMSIQLAPTALYLYGRF